MREYFVILTLQRTLSGGRVQTTTFTSTPTVAAHVSRAELFESIRANLPSDWHGTPVLFFSAEPNTRPTPPDSGGGQS
jgi:hypothetical protein